MKVLFKYNNDENMDIRTMSIIGSFNNYDSSVDVMSNINGEWICECDLKEGEHAYRFLVNGNLTINDPFANIYYPDEEDKLWSIVVIDNKDQRLYNNTQYSLNIDDYCLSSSMNESNIIKKEFNELIDDKIVARFDFTNVSGLHTATVAWYGPTGRMIQVTENNVFCPEGYIKPIKLWFWLDLKDKNIQKNEGNWIIKLFIDGEYILEDDFQLSKRNLYSTNIRY